MHDVIPPQQETSSLSLRERQKWVAQSSIEETALRLFLQQGYEHTSIQDIADAVKMSPRTFFRYFASKDEALLGPMRAAQQEALIALQRMAPTLTPHAALRAMLMLLARRYEEQRDKFVLRYQVVMQSPSIAALFLFTFVEAEPVISQALYTHLEAATDRNKIRFLVALHMAALRVAIEQWLESGDNPEDNHEEREDLIALLSQNLDQLSSLSLRQK
ncbi:MAG TPA: TetR family transcriptional regulator [Ktedonobacterales bacterium]|jgi:AcrR family transcriptional regulator|nr:TetR family transcriptional regulator [Ktedonobacterales bacterium]